MQPSNTAPEYDAPLRFRQAPILRPQAIAVGSSTGGPEALIRFFKTLDHNLRVPVFLTQHMPATFTHILCQQITRHTEWQCQEAQDGEAVRLGHIYVAPGDYHLGVTGTPDALTTHLSQDEKENFCRPSVEPMLRSLFTIFGKRVMVVMLTGMGHDGVNATKLVAEAGGLVVAQDKASSIVWGMPGAIATAGYCNKLGTPEDLARMVSSAVKAGVLV
jgi:two-component system chemotaxis response regulator CheB